jgi:hypothetical protein
VFGLAPGTSPDDVARTGRALVERFGTVVTATT